MESFAEDPLQFLWAVSYSDLLMVLMTFFIIYFQFSDQMAPTVLESLFSELKTELISTPTSNPSSGSQHGQADSSPNAYSFESLALDDLQKHKLQSNEDLRNGFAINLPENIYAPGQFELTAQGKRELSKILGIIKRRQRQVFLVFVGHTDKTGFRNAHGIVKSNLILSNLRAAKAAEFAVQNGMDPRFVSAKGVAQYSLGSRSLSMHLIERSVR